MAIQFKDYYETLGVPRTATQDEVKSAFRKMARKYHPDVAKNKATSEEKFKEINEAYEVLGDPEKRQKYDQLGENWQQPEGFSPPRRGGRRSRGAGAEGVEFEFGGTGFSDFFEAFFGGSGQSGFSATPQRRRKTPGMGAMDNFAQRGQDVEGDIMVTLEEVLNGSQRKISMTRQSRDGTEGPTNNYSVRIPPGVTEGQRIRLAGQGEPGTGGGSAGDLFLNVRLERHPDFTVQGSDLYYELNLAPWEAVLGVKAGIQTLDGQSTLKVPPGSQSGTQLRMRERGLPKDEGGRGDLYATISIQVPTTVSPEEQALWEKLASLSPFKAR